MQPKLTRHVYCLAAQCSSAAPSSLASDQALGSSRERKNKRSVESRGGKGKASISYNSFSLSREGSQLETSLCQCLPPTQRPKTHQRQKQRKLWPSCQRKEGREKYMSTSSTAAWLLSSSVRQNKCRFCSGGLDCRHKASRTSLTALEMMVAATFIQYMKYLPETILFLFFLGGGGFPISSFLTSSNHKWAKGSGEEGEFIPTPLLSSRREWPQKSPPKQERTPLPTDSPPLPFLCS